MESDGSGVTPDNQIAQGTSGGGFVEIPASVNVLSVLWILWSKKIFILVTTFVCALLIVGASYMRPPTFTAKVTILPRQNSKPSILPSQLSSFLPSSLDGDVEYEDLYPQIIRSDRILDLASSRLWRFGASGDSLTLFQVFHIKQDSPKNIRLSHRSLKEKLRKSVIGFSVERPSGFMTLKVNAPEDGAFAAEFANFLAQQLGIFLTTLRSRKAVEQQNFISEHLQDAEKSLERAEDHLTTFQEENRAIASSPTLLRRQRALMRDVDAESTIWIELRKQLELAILEDNKQKFSIDVLDSATPPVVRSAPIRSYYLALGVFIGFFVSIVLLLARHWIRGLRSEMLVGDA